MQENSCFAFKIHGQIEVKDPRGAKYQSLSRDIKNKGNPKNAARERCVDGKLFFPHAA